MLFRTHLAFSIFLSFIALNFFELNFVGYIIFFVFVFLGTALVDIDSRNSKIGKFFLFRPLQWVIPHRAIFHSVFFVFLLGFFVYMVSKVATIGFFIGYLSHLFLDILTPSGLKLFWPVYPGKISLLGIKTGGIVEEIIFILLLFADLGIFIRLFL